MVAERNEAVFSFEKSVSGFGIDARGWHSARCPRCGVLRRCQPWLVLRGLEALWGFSAVRRREGSRRVESLFDGRTDNVKNGC